MITDHRFVGLPGWGMFPSADKACQHEGCGMPKGQHSTNLNAHMRESLTAWGETISMQMRHPHALYLHHMAGAPRASEDGQPWLIPVADARILRDLLNAATDRGQL